MHPLLLKAKGRHLRLQEKAKEREREAEAHWEAAHASKPSTAGQEGVQTIKGLRIVRNKRSGEEQRHGRARRGSST